MIALALGGGAALGWAHIGVLRVLEEEGIGVGAVAGTSIGALAAVCLAADRLDALEAIARGATRRRVLAYLDPAFRRGAVLGGRRIARELAEHLGPDRRFADLAVPCATVAADLDSAAEVRLREGLVIPAVRASIALPGLFRPVRIDGRVLIDGGMVATVPLGAARALAPALPLVAVDLMGDYRGHVAAGGWGARGRSALATFSSAFLMLIVRQTELALALDPPDVLIAPRIGHHSTGAFHQAEALIAAGRAAAEAALPAIRAAIAGGAAA